MISYPKAWCGARAIHIILESDTITSVKTRLIITVFMVVSAIIAPTVLAQEPATQSVDELIAERCALTQQYLKDIQRPRDLRARVDRLQAYRYIFQRLDVFVKRLEKNQQPQAQELRTALNDFNKNIENFKTSYEQYDVARDTVVSVKNCKTNIADFQQQLAKAREKRQLVAESVIKTEEILKPTVHTQLESLHETLLRTSGSGGAR